MHQYSARIFNRASSTRGLYALSRPPSINYLSLRHSTPSALASAPVARRQFSLHPSDYGYQEWGDKPGPRKSPWSFWTLMTLGAVFSFSLATVHQRDMRQSEKEKEQQQGEKSSQADKPSGVNDKKKPPPSDRSSSGGGGGILPRAQCEAASPLSSEDDDDTYPSSLRRLHRDARYIFGGALGAANPSLMIQHALTLDCSRKHQSCTLSVAFAEGRRLLYDLGEFNQIVLLGAGKASQQMVHGVSEVLRLGNAQSVSALPPVTIHDGMIVTKAGSATPSPFSSVAVREAAHPIPDESSINSATEMTHILNKYSHDPHTLILFLLSGGASSLMVQPAQGLQLKDIQAANRAFLASGMPISQINFLRKHMDDIKGGGIAEKAGSAQVLSLILSDVIGDDINDIGSGPTVPMKRDYHAALKVLDEYGLRPSRSRREKGVHAPESDPTAFPLTVYQHMLNRATEGMNNVAQSLTPADAHDFSSPLSLPASSCFASPSNIVIGSNHHSLVAAAKIATKLGYEPTIVTDRLEGEACEAARWLSKFAIPVLEQGEAAKNSSSLSLKPRAFLLGGETTVTFKKDAGEPGLGGRNQEFALCAALQLKQFEQPLSPSSVPLHRTVILAGGTDGTDGPTDATGAVVDGMTVDYAQAVGLNAETFLRKHDSYHFFQALDQANATITHPKIPPSHLKPGPTGTNVADIYIALQR